jgi:GNAT superfamily N-acetyltransferase
MRFRDATLLDVPAIAALHAANWRETYRGILVDAYLDGDLLAERTQVWSLRFEAPEPHQRVVIAEEQQTLLGFACMYGAHDVEAGTLLENLHVATATRGTGLGTRLVQEVARWSHRHHPQSGLHLWALERNAAARHFYERLGGVVTASGVWSPPVGPAVAEVRYGWPRPAALLAITR